VSAAYNTDLFGLRPAISANFAIGQPSFSPVPSLKIAKKRPNCQKKKFPDNWRFVRQSSGYAVVASYGGTTHHAPV
jgi:hypothetical protein